MSNLDLLSAGFSAILGATVIPQKHGGKFSIHDLFCQTYIMRPLSSSPPDPGEFGISVKTLHGKVIPVRVKEQYSIYCLKTQVGDKEGLPLHGFKLIFAGETLEDDLTIGDYGIGPDCTVFLGLVLRGGGAQLPCSLNTFNTDELDPTFDYDFTDLVDDGTQYMRGGFEYKRPYGWNRIAIKVVGRYGDDDWLGPEGMRTKDAQGEWPVTYHGTNMCSARMIVKEGYKPGPRALYGKGIYTSPSLEMIEGLYAQEFTHRGKAYKIVLQNRVKPDQSQGHLDIIPASRTGVGADYWLSSACNLDVRPYGILIREVPKPKPAVQSHSTKGPSQQLRPYVSSVRLWQRRNVKTKSN
ncbi:uncharacterized protein [Montipora foliosa]|uniref:uncharacterized protein n=1 Tax=Montipora foliosa TaxID=591990 RepID=UPI0035F1721F